MKLFIVYIFVVVVGVYAFLKLYKIEEKFEYDFQVVGFNLGDVGNLLSGLFKGDQEITINFKLDLTNKSEVEIEFSKLYLEIYYNGVMVAVTPTFRETLNQTVFKPGQKGSYNGLINVKLNAQTVNLGTAIYLKKLVKIGYNIKFVTTMFDIPVSHKGFIELNK